MNATLEPYAARLKCSVDTPISADTARALIASLLEEIGRQCQKAGARLIGHIKCLAECPEGYLRGSLTDFGRPADVAGELSAPVRTMEVLLHVLVYGLPADALHQCVISALHELGQAASAHWTHRRLGHDHPAGHVS